ncbi:MAG: acetate--CoA ligase family protein [Thermoleophilia bacterium]|jgi:acyl-CoA synthetase (NDP forming)|nr:acetate--CoA ligase family protein [Thermoleophilia bacterium]
MTGVSESVTHMLAEPEAAELLASCDIPYVEHAVAGSAGAAVAVAGRIGYPVVLKVVSPDIVHKTEAGGVVVGLRDEQALREGYDQVLGRARSSCPEARIAGVLVGRHVDARRELIVGAIHDATFGPTVMVGLGGVFAEALSDVAFRLAPLRLQDGLDMLRELRGARLLAGFRGEPAIDLDGVAAMLVGVGGLLLSHREIAEIDLNPVAASADGCVALDVRIVVKD